MTVEIQTQQVLEEKKFEIVHSDVIQPAATPEGDQNIGDSAKQGSAPAKEIPAADASAEPAPVKNRVQRRIDRLTLDKNTIARERDALRIELDAAKGTKEGTEPDVTAYEDYDKYLEARDAWRDGKGKESVPPVIKDGIWDSPEVKESLAVVTDTFDESRTKYADFDTAIKSNGHLVTPEMVKILAESDEPGDLVYYLCNKPDEAKRIADLSAVEKVKAIVKIEAELNKAPEKPKVPVKKQSNAPPPIDVVVGSGNSVPRSLSDAKSQSDYRAMREATSTVKSGWI